MNNYSSMLLNGISQYKELSIKDIPLVINTINTSFSLAFIDYEDEDTLGINYTVKDGTERFVVLNKKYIVDIEVLYKQDIDIIKKKSNHDLNIMYF